MRGEYTAPVWIRSDHVELPPRARRIPPPKSDCYHTIGTTSACAENTAVVLACFLPQWNYLRVRGEYQATDVASLTTRELPPRARRILLARRTNCAHHGTTSACAENTPAPAQSFAWPGNYLRVRGEYACACSVFCMAWELPPRARRIQTTHNEHNRPSGTTSACAENTLPSTSVDVTDGNYLRVRGEYSAPALEKESTWELPPRARRIHMCGVRHFFLPGTTSACAENT